MLEKVRKLNNGLTIHTTKDIEFKKYGKVLNIDATDLIETLLSKEELEEIKSAPKAGYVTDRKELHNCKSYKTIQQTIFGCMPTQIGVVKGRNNALTGTEFHQGSEVNVAVTDCILVLGNKEDLLTGSVDVSQMEIFYVEKGEVLEIYSTTLHYTPIEANQGGFSLVVILLEGTNTDIPFVAGSMLCKRNKWYVCHASQTAKIEAGFKVGLTGDLLTINS